MFPVSDTQRHFIHSSFSEASHSNLNWLNWPELDGQKHLCKKRPRWPGPGWSQCAPCRSESACGLALCATDKANSEREELDGDGEALPHARAPHRQHASKVLDDVEVRGVGTQQHGPLLGGVTFSPVML